MCKSQHTKKIKKIKKSVFCVTTGVSFKYLTKNIAKHFT